jgi:hypothetical protein
MLQKGIAVAGGLATMALAYAGARPTNPALESLLAVRVAADVLEAEMGQAGAPPGPRGAFVSLSEIVGSFNPSGRRLLGNGKDAWGNPLGFWTDGNHVLIVSYGSDGAPDVPYNPSYFPWTALASATTTDPRADILIVDGLLWRGPITSREALRRVMADLRSVATAIESYSVDFSFYPTTDGYENTEALRPTLEPVYIKRIPLLDPWNSPFGAWSRFTDGYALVSYGSDGTPEHDYESWGLEEWNSLEPAQTVEPGRDIIVVNGQFVQWPLPMP